MGQLIIDDGPPYDPPLFNSSLERKQIESRQQTSLLNFPLEFVEYSFPGLNGAKNNVKAQIIL